tara:strand:+ start:14046 stop:14825 length:780 start_codon:yes stop_codon:yes gene_type:complete
MVHQGGSGQNDVVQVVNGTAASQIVLVCEHASNVIPPRFDGLGLPDDARESHVAWDPGALGVAQEMAMLLDAALVAGGVSRLVYDCNRPPDAADAMPAQSEVFAIPGNTNLSDADRADRVTNIYEPFRATLAQTVAGMTGPVIVTVHSFTPIYHGTPRTVEVGILHDSDSRLADAMIATASVHTELIVQRNEPYGPQHGVTHTLLEHALPGGHPNVMLEVRNDLIATKAAQRKMAEMIAGWLREALVRPEMQGAMSCAS